MLILTLVERQALGLFLGTDSPALQIGVHIGRIATWGFILFAASPWCCSGAVRANGQVIWPLIILFISLYPVRLGWRWGLRGWLGPDALWISFPVAMLTTVLGGQRAISARRLAPLAPDADRTCGPARA